MSEKEKQVEETLRKALPQMSDNQKNYLLGYGEAVLDMRGPKKETEAEKPELVEA